MILIFSDSVSKIYEPSAHRLQSNIIHKNDVFVFLLFFFNKEHVTFPLT